MNQPSDSSSAALEAVQQRRESLHGAMNHFDDALAAPVPNRTSEWTSNVFDALQTLRECMQVHIAATEGSGGFLQEMVTAAPRLAHAAEVSTREHRAVIELMDVIATGLEAGGESPASEIRQQGDDLLRLLARHRQRGADMIYEAYEVELGGED